MTGIAEGAWWGKNGSDVAAGRTVGKRGMGVSVLYRRWKEITCADFHEEKENWKTRGLRGKNAKTAWQYFAEAHAATFAWDPRYRRCRSALPRSLWAPWATPGYPPPSLHPSPLFNFPAEERAVGLLSFPPGPRRGAQIELGAGWWLAGRAWQSQPNAGPLQPCNPPSAASVCGALRQGATAVATGKPATRQPPLRSPASRGE